jgi:MinD-like ATPase involved in chromosome partitioning or flagellar assembly
MTVVSVLSAKGCPGATSTSLTVAGLMKAKFENRTLLECDPAGGDLALRMQKSSRPGLITLAAERTEITRALIDHHSQALSDGVNILFGTQGFEQFILVEDIISQVVTNYIETDDLLVVDLGRWDPHVNLTNHILESSKLILLVIDGSSEGIVSARSILSSLKTFEKKISVVITGTFLFDKFEVESFLKRKVVGILEEIFKISESFIADSIQSVKLKSEVNKNLINLQKEIIDLLFDSEENSIYGNKYKDEPSVIQDCSTSSFKRRFFRRLNTSDESSDVSEIVKFENFGETRDIEQSISNEENEFLQLVEEL